MAIPFDQFKTVELKVAEVKEVARVEGSEKLLRLIVDLGDEERQIIAGIGKKYAPEDIAGKQIVIVANLESRSLMGLESQGMILAATNEEGLPIILKPEEKVPNGTLIK